MQREQGIQYRRVFLLTKDQPVGIIASGYDVPNRVYEFGALREWWRQVFVTKLPGGERLMLREEKIKLVETYLESLLNKDLSRVSLADNVTFEGPRMPKLTGRQSVLGFLQKIMLPAVKDIRVKQTHC